MLCAQACDLAKQLVAGADGNWVAAACSCSVLQSALADAVHAGPVSLCCAQAFDLAKQVVAGAGGNIIPRLRDFHPALVGYALVGNADKAGEVVACMMEHCKPGDLTGGVLLLSLLS
jgi:hypothetical protein